MELLYPWWAKATIRDHGCCNQVIVQARGRKLDVLVAFASGLCPQEVAAQLCLSEKTVDTHKTRLLALCRKTWNIGPDIYLDYRFLYTKFAKELQKNESVISVETDAQKNERCKQALAEVKGRELDVLYAIAYGLRPPEIASQFQISVATVHTYTPKLLMRCRNVWDIKPDIYLDYRFLYIKFARYFNQQSEVYD